ncbi:hypothetical protein V8E51_013941 [Hyaloscypha variabilis]
MSFVDYMSQMVRGQDGQLVVYFFCDNTSDKRNTLSNVCKSLLYQILEKVLSHQNDDTTKFLRNFENKGDGIFDSVEAIRTILEEVLSWADLDKIYFIVDALDEYINQKFSYFPNGRLESVQKCQSFTPKREMGSLSTMNIDLETYEEDVRKSVEQFVEVKVEQLSILKR